MADPAYSKQVPLQDPSIAPSAPPVDVVGSPGSAPPPHIYDPPPPYEAGNYVPPQGYQPAVSGPPAGPPPAGYSQPVAPVQYVQQPQPAQVIITQGQPAAVAPVIVTQTLAPGVCSVCRKGKIRNTRTCCTYICCLFLCFFGVLPGLIAFFFCCRKPKCSHCGYTP